MNRQSRYAAFRESTPQARSKTGGRLPDKDRTLSIHFLHILLCIHRRRGEVCAREEKRIVVVFRKLDVWKRRMRTCLSVINDDVAMMSPCHYDVATGPTWNGFPVCKRISSSWYPCRRFLSHKSFLLSMSVRLLFLRGRRRPREHPAQTEDPNERPSKINMKEREKEESQESRTQPDKSDTTRQTDSFLRISPVSTIKI